MPTLEQALASLSKTLAVSHQPNGQNIPGVNMGGEQTSSTPSGGPSAATGTALTVRSRSSEIGEALGRIGAIGKPQTADQAARLAEQLVATLLPPSMASWIDAQERKAIDGMEPFPRVPKPERTPELVECISLTVKSLSEITSPAKNRPAELALELSKMFAGFNLFAGDSAKLATQVEVWGEELGEYPLYAIRKACKWAIRGGERLPSLAAFLADVRLAVGSKVLTRKKLLLSFLNTDEPSAR
ncbi:hypothetical protein V5G24_10030 [Xanthobacter sp. VTT E-85241]|uniref:hypothetical protein n=1 Tax=Roseixanthobacter finlandensis TaxID=3119922 RepID=UPI00372B7EB5